MICIVCSRRYRLYTALNTSRLSWLQDSRSVTIVAEVTAVHWVHALTAVKYVHMFLWVQTFNVDNNQVTGSIPATWSKQGLMRTLGLNNNTGLT